MIKMSVETVIVAFVEAMLPRFSDDKQLLKISLDMEASAPENPDKHIRRYAHLLFHRPSNYTKVLWNVTDDPRKGYDDFETWDVKSDHDSCWRTDGLSSPMFEEYMHLVKRLKTKARPIDCDVTARFRMLTEPKVITVKGYKHDRDNFKFSVQWR